MAQMKDHSGALEASAFQHSVRQLFVDWQFVSTVFFIDTNKCDR